MSPIEFLINQLRSGLPEGAKLRSVAVELPDGSLLTTTLVPPGRVAAPSGAERDELRSPDGPSDSVPRDCQSNDEYSAGRLSFSSSRRERVARFRQRHGGEARLKPREWAPIAQLSVREIERAIKANALLATAKGDGRDHGAKVVTADAMEAYVATIDMVLRGKAEPPTWWNSVRS